MVGSTTRREDNPKKRKTKIASRRLSKAERRIQLLDTSLKLIREEGVDRLTLGRLALRAGVSKPVVYDHFGTRSGLLIELYKAIDAEMASALRDTLTSSAQSPEETIQVLASTYIHCAVDTGGERHTVGAALAGSQKKEAVYQELLDGYVQLFVTVLKPYSTLSQGKLERRCVGLVGAGEALSAGMMRGYCNEMEATETFIALIQGGLSSSLP